MSTYAIVDEKLVARVEARKQARELAGDLKAEMPREFIEALVEQLTPQPGPEVERERISYHEACEYVLPFGKHADCQLQLIDTEYLEWLCRESETTLANIQAYLRGYRARNERGQE